MVQEDALTKSEQAGHSGTPVYRPRIISTEGSVGSIEFASIFEPVHEQEQLTAISNAYPHLIFTYEYAEKGA